MSQPPHCRIVPTSRLVRLALVAVGAVVAAVAAAAPASAHNVLVSTNPVDHQHVGRAPAAVVLTFDEPALAMGTRLVITGPSGAVQQGPPQLVDNTVSQAVGGGTPAGEYTVAWRATSADGHPITGTFSFTADRAGGASPGTASPSPVSTEPSQTGTSARPWWVAGLLAVGLFGVFSVIRWRRGRGARRVGDT